MARLYRYDGPLRKLTTGPRSVTLQPNATLRLSWEHAKALALQGVTVRIVEPEPEEAPAEPDEDTDEGD